MFMLDVLSTRKMAAQRICGITFVQDRGKQRRLHGGGDF